MPAQPTPAAKWYSLNTPRPMAAGNGNTEADVFVFGNIGDSWDENGVMAADFVRDIAALQVAKINLRINSFGGSVSDGLAIYNALKRHPADIAVSIEGVALSCASYIAMAGDTISMAENGLMMIHAPWGVAWGNAAELRDQADVLDKFAYALATGYAARTGQSTDDVIAQLLDGTDHWYTAAEAQEAGLCDAIGPAIEAVAMSGTGFAARFKPPQDASQPNPSAATQAAAAVPVPAPAGRTSFHPTGATMDPKDPTTQAGATPTPAAQPFARTREHNQSILAIFKPFADRADVQALQTEILADPSITVEAAQAKLLGRLGEGAGPANPQNAAPHVTTEEDETDKRRAAMVQALCVRAGVETDRAVRAQISANPFRGHKLLDMARASLQRAGVRVDGMTQMEVVAAAFTQGTSDFPILLENTMHKSLQAAYATAALTWNRFCATGTVSDFRASNRYRVGSFGTLDSKTELGEFKNKSIPDGEKASITASSKGNIINLSREAVINDDLGAFVGLSGSLGRAAARTVEVDVYALLALNGGLGPTMADGNTLFHANHGNIGTAGALSVTTLDEARVKMASQKDVGGNDYLDLRPAALLVPMGLGSTARVINDAQYDPDTANKLQRPNAVRGLFADIVDTPRLAGTRFYAFADPMVAPVLEVAFLDGQQEPYLEMQDGFTVDGARWKVRLDYGTAAIDYRGAVTNAGA